MNFFSFQPKDQIIESMRRKDRYRILGLLGKGRSAEVLTHFDSLLSRIVASKQLRKEHVNDEHRVRAFLNEAKLVSYLDHPGVVTIYDAFLNENSEPCYTMKLIRGNNLRWELGSRSRSQLLSIFSKLCETLAYVHDKGVIHLDLNPENIMIGQYGEVMITDWGNARLFDLAPYNDYLKLVRDAPPPPVNDSTNTSYSTMHYLSPEHLSGDRDSLSPSSDIFSLGALLYEMMSGTLPFDAQDKESLFGQIKGSNPPLLHEVCPEIPRMLSMICAKMLEKDTYLRYHSVHELLMDIDRFNNSGQAFSIRKYNPGDIIFNEGDQGDFAFTILAGSVEVTKIVDGQPKLLAKLGKNDIVGEVSVFTNEPRTATITAVEPTAIRVMDQDSVEQELQKLSPWVQKMITELSKRFIKVNEQVAK